MQRKCKQTAVSATKAVGVDLFFKGCGGFRVWKSSSPLWNDQSIMPPSVQFGDEWRAVFLDDDDDEHERLKPKYQ